MEIKRYSDLMQHDFYSLFIATSGEMNVQKNEVEHRVLEIAAYHVDKSSPFFTAWEDGKMVGYAIAKRDDLGRKKSSAHVAQLRVSVHPDYQAKGIGTALVKNVIAAASLEGVVKRIEVLNYATSIDDRHWFEKLGFEIEGRLRDRIFANDTYIDAYSMAYIL